MKLNESKSLGIRLNKFKTISRNRSPTSNSTVHKLSLKNQTVFLNESALGKRKPNPVA